MIFIPSFLACCWEKGALSHATVRCRLRHYTKAVGRKVLLGERCVLLGERCVLLGERCFVVGRKVLCYWEKGALLLGERCVLLGERCFVVGRKVRAVGRNVRAVGRKVRAIGRKVLCCCMPGLLVLECDAVA